MDHEPSAAQGRRQYRRRSSRDSASAGGGLEEESGERSTSRADHESGRAAGSRPLDFFCLFAASPLCFCICHQPPSFLAFPAHLTCLPPPYTASHRLTRYCTVFH
ncbi:hypothetical protein NDU88_003486 [Pleurodeles waltl]|uniref:Uncharacterized protein n=1 Tax=Pleurodeles waltl TaxID=8319 RepID=A0AAV7LH40_PLEWA|nr:hypothetical protein NDU88_003486 [Pleurodeles waltl]